jgi:hypothetical protein
MKLTIAFVLSLAFGCAGAAKKPAQPEAGTYSNCPLWTCPNGTRSTGTADDTAPRVESVTPPRERRVECPRVSCGGNGTRSTGTADDTVPRVESVTLPSGGSARTR